MRSQQVAIIVVVLFILTGCVRQQTSVTPEPVNVHVAAVTMADPGQGLVYSGTIEESESIPLTFPQVGTVARVLVAEGAPVRKGQVLATIDTTSYHSTWLMMLASQRQAEDAHKRMSAMYKNGTVPEVKYVEVETGLQKARASAAIARKNLDDCRLCAPADGFIGKLSIEPGMTAMPNVVSLTIVRIGKVFARVPVAETEISAIRKGQAARVIIGALAGQVFDGVVEETGVVADPMAHTYKVRIAVQNKDLRIMPGMICSATIRAQRGGSGLVVPGSAVLVDEAGAQFVYRVSAQKAAVRTPIFTGTLLNNGIEVLSGLAADDIVVIHGQQRLVDGSPVRIVN
jgi:membrane fusion protein, multidrug efflux system